MKVVGISRTAGDKGVLSTLYVTDVFDSYFSNSELGRSCTGMKAESIYVGDYDVSKLKIGDEIEIYYGKALTTAKGVFQTIKKIDVVKGV